MHLGDRESSRCAHAQYTGLQRQKVLSLGTSMLTQKPSLKKSELKSSSKPFKIKGVLSVFKNSCKLFDQKFPVHTPPGSSGRHKYTKTTAEIATYRLNWLRG